MPMGPILIFDKSTLQGLNPDEAVWLDNFFMSNITPLFYTETLADLTKEMKKGRTAEQIVGEIAYKTPDMQSRANVHHMALVWGELMGKGEITMVGFPILGRGQPVMLEGCTGIVYKQSPEAEALNRWREGQFLEVERGYGRKWREELDAVDLNAMKISFTEIWEKAGRPRSLEEIKSLADNIIDGPEQRAVLLLGLSLCMMNQEWSEQIISRWEGMGMPKVRDFAPYFTHVLTVDLTFYLAITAGLVGSERKSNRADIAYLYYLPFCMVFTSRDKLHSKLAPLFLRPDQSFVDGGELKADLKRIDEHYSAFPDDVKAQGLYAFAPVPPNDDSFLVTRLWNKHMKKPERLVESQAEAFNGKTLNVPPAGSDPEEIVKVLDAFEANAVPAGPEADIALENASVVTFQTFIIPKKGKWLRVPRNVFED
jgi:hypothetical protein